jgi:hypothetical protein
MRVIPLTPTRLVVCRVPFFPVVFFLTIFGRVDVFISPQESVLDVVFSICMVPQDFQRYAVELREYILTSLAKSAQLGVVRRTRLAGLRLSLSFHFSGQSYAAGQSPWPF